MRPIILLIVILSIFSGGCKYLKKQKMFSKNLDTLVNSDTAVAEIANDTITFAAVTENVNDIFEEPKVVKPIVSPDGRYFMIVGSFQYQTNAEKYVKKLENMGYAARVIPSDIGYYRVSAQTYSTLQGGLDDIPNFRSAVTPGAWVHIKKR
ncbi:MAG: SPOR domain-containing protein [Bacteroidales bacterium]|nr:SPOR domain-containing protein [Bacteroidales bacterium]